MEGTASKDALALSWGSVGGPSPMLGEHPGGGGESGLEHTQGAKTPRGRRNQGPTDGEWRGDYCSTKLRLAQLACAARC